MSRRKTPTDPVKSNVDAASNCLAMLDQLSENGKVDRKRFVAEMQSRSMEHYGKPLAKSSVTHLGVIVDAYERGARS